MSTQASRPALCRRGQPATPPMAALARRAVATFQQYQHLAARRSGLASPLTPGAMLSSRSAGPASGRRSGPWRLLPPDVDEDIWNAGPARASAAGATAAPTATVIDGKAIAAVVRAEIAAEVTRLKALTGRVPGLAVVLVGERKDSQTYVRNKKKACAEAGITSFGADLPADATEADVVAVVAAFNADPRVHGVLVQLPLPAGISEERVLGAVSIAKDVDGFHPLNVGALAQRGRDPLFVPCTPKGCLELLDRTGVTVAGKHAVVVGRSNVVGLPVALLLQRRDATLTVVHSRTRDPEGHVRRADIVIAAAGQAELVRGTWLKPGCAVIDVGINAVDDPASKVGYRLVGDVCFAEAVHVAGHITPVPGGVGPMTIAMLLQNTLEGFARAEGVAIAKPHAAK